MFSLANSVLISLFLILALLVGGTKIVVLEEAVLEEERPYPKPVWSEADFYMKNKTKQNWKKNNKNMLNNQSIKTRLTQNLKKQNT